MYDLLFGICADAPPLCVVSDLHASGQNRGAVHEADVREVDGPRRGVLDGR